MDFAAEIEALKTRVAVLEARNGRLQNENDYLRDAIEDSDLDVVYVASTSRSTFHLVDCEWARYIPDRKRIEFSSHREARDAGYRPCKTCRA